MRKPAKHHSNRSRYQEALRLYKAGDYREAASLLREMTGSLGLIGHMSRFYHSLSCRKAAEDLVAGGDFESAASLLCQGIESTPRSGTMIDFLADCYLRQGNYGAAGTELSRLQELTGGNSSLRFKEGVSLYLAGETDRAVTVLEELSKKHPDNYDVIFSLGMILAGDEEAARAVPYLIKACRLRPENVDAHWKLGLAQGMGGHLLEAIHHLQQAHRLEPENHWLMTHLILAIKQARQQGIEIRADIVRSQEIEQVREDRELDKLAEMIARDPEFVTAFLDLPRTEVDDQIFTSLLEIMIRALDTHPEYADLHYHCSCIYHRLGQSERAIEQSQQALELNPRYLGALVHLAKLYAQTDRDSHAIDRLKRAVEMGANYADVHYLLGELYQRQGSLNYARVHYQRALTINDKFYAARDALAELTV